MMRNPRINKEYGSDFHYDFHEISGNYSTFIPDSANLFFSGRAALYALMRFGIEKYNWKNIYIPSYYCHEVVDFIEDLTINIEYFPCNPFIENGVKLESVVDSEENVILNVSYFGQRSINLEHFSRIIIIDDLTHDLEGLVESKGHYALGSLRKILPISCGGFLYSSKGLAIPKEIPSNEAKEVAVRKSTAMYLKRIYLMQGVGEKDFFRELYVTAEESFCNIPAKGGIPEIAKAQLHDVDCTQIINDKKRNLRYVFDSLDFLDGVQYNFGEYHDRALGLLFHFKESIQRDELRRFLIDQKIYPAVLWPSQKTVIDKQVSDSILFIHIDYRYSTEDMTYIVDTLNQFFKND